MALPDDDPLVRAEAHGAMRADIEHLKTWRQIVDGDLRSIKSQVSYQSRQTANFAGKFDSFVAARHEHDAVITPLLERLRDHFEAIDAGKKTHADQMAQLTEIGKLMIAGVVSLSGGLALNLTHGVPHISASMGLGCVVVFALISSFIIFRPR